MISGGCQDDPDPPIRRVAKSHDFYTDTAEQRYHKIKYKLRRIIGHVAAKQFLQKHGNTILFVNPEATHEEIIEVLKNAPIQEVRKRIRENRKSRNSLDQCVYDQKKWDAEITKLEAMFAPFMDLKNKLT